MAKVKTRSKFDIIARLDEIFSPDTVDKLGRLVVRESKDMISKGISPVRGHGRFERYKNKDNYPGDLKPARPVNLKLTGDMLSGYSYKRKNKTTMETGMVNGSQKSKEIAGYHQSGTKNMAQRRMTPGLGEEFAVTIMRKIRDVFSASLARTIKKANKK